MVIVFEVLVHVDDLNLSGIYLCALYTLLNDDELPFQLRALVVGWHYHQSYVPFAFATFHIVVDIVADWAFHLHLLVGMYGDSVGEEVKVIDQVPLVIP